MERTDDNSQMGADLFSGLDRCRYPRIHRYLGGFGGRRPLPVLRLRGDLPRVANSRADDLQGVVLAPDAAQRVSVFTRVLWLFAERQEECRTASGTRAVLHTCSI